MKKAASAPTGGTRRGRFGVQVVVIGALSDELRAFSHLQVFWRDFLHKSLVRHVLRHLEPRGLRNFHA